MEHKEVTTQPNPYQNLWRATHCSICFFILFVALNSSQNIQTQLFEDDGYGKLGLYSNAAIYLGVGLGCLGATAGLRKWGVIKCLVLGAVLCIPFMGAFILPVMKSEKSSYSLFIFSDAFIWTAILFFSFLHGLGEALLFVAQGKYIADCATQANKGFFFGYFWAFYMSSQIIGNYVAALILGTMSQTAFFAVMTGVTVVSTVAFTVMKIPLPHHAPALMGTALNETAIEEDETQLEEPEPAPMATTWGDITDVVRLALSRRMLKLIPICAWTGVSIAFYSGVLVSMLTSTMVDTDTNQQYEQSMMAMVVFGFGEMLGCFFTGYVIDKRGSKFAAIVDLLTITSTVAVTLLFLATNEFSVLAYLMTFMWGFQDSGVNTHLSEILGFEFGIKSGEAFSVFNMVQAFGVFLFELLEAHVDNYTRYLAYVLALGILGIAASCAAFSFEYKGQPPFKPSAVALKAIRALSRASRIGEKQH